MAFEKKKQPAVAASKWTKKKKEIEPRVPYRQEYLRDVRFKKFDLTTYVWVFTEFKEPTAEAPQFRLIEEKFVMEGRDRVRIPTCPVVWEVDMSVRIRAYADYQKFIGSLRNDA